MAVVPWQTKGRRGSKGPNLSIALKVGLQVRQEPCSLCSHCVRICTDRRRTEVAAERVAAYLNEHTIPGAEIVLIRDAVMLGKSPKLSIFV